MGYVMQIEELRKALQQGIVVEYKAHCQKRMLERGITRGDILECIQKGEIIEEYPLNDENKSEKSFPACLVLGIEINANKMLHVVVGYNTRKMIIISAYRPDDEHFEKDGKTRKER